MAASADGLEPCVSSWFLEPHTDIKSHTDLYHLNRYGCYAAVQGLKCKVLWPFKDSINFFMMISFCLQKGTIFKNKGFVLLKQ